MGIILLLVVVLLVIAAVPHWPYNRGWGAGYYPAGVLLAVLLILILLSVLGYMPVWHSGRY